MNDSSVATPESLLFEMPLRTIRNQLLPLATKQRFLSFLNPVLRSVSSAPAVQARLARLLDKHGIQFLDLGGWMPVEGYLTIHLSPVEPYGRASVPGITYRQVFDAKAGSASLERRALSAPAVSLHFNVGKGLPLADQSLQGVNLSHFLEHFPLAEGEVFIREIHRVLKPGGIVRVSCPDLRKYAQAYISRDEGFFRAMAAPAFCRYPKLDTPGDRFISKAYDNDNGHRWFYDAESVIHLLKSSGFTQSEERRLHQSLLPSIEEVEPAYRAPESFYVEAIR